MASARMRKAKILFRDTLDSLLDDDPGCNEGNSAKSQYSSTKSVSGHSGTFYSLVYKCKRCRRTLATSHNLMPHVAGETPEWRDEKWSLPAEEVRERQQ